MEDKLRTNINNRLKDLETHIRGIGLYYPRIYKRISNNNALNEIENPVLLLGTIVRVKGSQNTWFDVPVIEKYNIPLKYFKEDNIHLHREMQRIYESFNISAYKTMNMFIANTDNAIISKYQMTEKERILKAYKNNEI